MKAEFHLQRVSKKQNNFLPEHSLRHYCYISSQNREFSDLSFFLSFSMYCQALAFEHYRQVYIVHSGLQDESLQVTISKLP